MTLQEILAPWWGFYNDPWFWQFPIATMGLSIAVFLTFALPWTWLAWRDPVWLRDYKIQAKPLPVKEYFWPSIGRIVINNIILCGLLVMTWPLLKMSGIHLGAMPAWYVVIFQLILFVLVDDFLYYWMHRWFHENKWLLRHVHSVHHRIRNTCAINGNYMHWIEFSATAGLMLLVPILIGAHLYVVFIWVVIRQFEAVDGHTGYDVPYNPAHYLPLYEGPAYHDFHHARFKGNYAGALPYLDRFMGKTHIAEYLAYRRSRRSGMKPQEIAQVFRSKVKTSSA